MAKLLVLPGDGIGTELTDAAMIVFEAAAAKFGFHIQVERGLIGGAAIEQTGEALPRGTMRKVRTAQAILLGAVGGPSWHHLPKERRPEQVLWHLRRALGLYGMIRPVRVYDFLEERSFHRPEIIRGVDFVLCREVMLGLVTGEQHAGHDYAWDRMEYTRAEIWQIVRDAFEIAALRPRKEIVSVDKAHLLQTSVLWREVVDEVARSYPEVKVEHMHVDRAVYQMVTNPCYFDVIVAENTFGEVIGSIAAALSGSPGMVPSASRGNATSLYESGHRSLPEWAGTYRVNPVGTILSMVMALEMSFDQREAAAAIRRAVASVLAEDIKTEDIAGPASRVVGTLTLAEEIAHRLG